MFEGSRSKISSVFFNSELSFLFLSFFLFDAYDTASYVVKRFGGEGETKGNNIE